MENETPTVGKQELELLRYVADHAPISVRDTAEQYGAPRQLARTTILTVMERLRKKNYLTRRKDGGAFLYSPAQSKPQLLQTLVGDFVEKTLGGSLSPFVAYLADAPAVSNDELAELRALVSQMERGRE